jgi:hypothetical protein
MGKWIIQAAKDIYSFVYNEVGAILKLFKDASGKYSHKRIIALALVLDGLLGIVKVTTWLGVVIWGGQILIGVALAIYTALTKT